MIAVLKKSNSDTRVEACGPDKERLHLLLCYR